MPFIGRQQRDQGQAIAVHRLIFRVTEIFRFGTGVAVLNAFETKLENPIGQAPRQFLKGLDIGFRDVQPAGRHFPAVEDDRTILKIVQNQQKTVFPKRAVDAGDDGLLVGRILPKLNHPIRRTAFRVRLRENVIVVVRLRTRHCQHLCIPRMPDTSLVAFVGSHSFVGPDGRLNSYKH